MKIIVFKKHTVWILFQEQNVQVLELYTTASLKINCIF